MSWKWLVWSSLVWSAAFALENGVIDVPTGEATSEGSTSWMQAQNSILDDVLRPYRPLVSPAASPAVTSRPTFRASPPARRDRTSYNFNHPPIRTERFCYQLIHMKEKGNIDLVVRLPRISKLKAFAHDCYNTDFPTHSAHLGNAEIVLDFNQRPDAANISTIQHISISPGDEHIAVVFGADEWVDVSYADIEPSGLSLVVQSLALKEPPIFLTQEFNYPIVWNKDYLYYTAFNTSGSKISVMRHSLGKDASQSKVIFEQAYSAGYLTLSGTKNYIFVVLSTLEESTVMAARRSDTDPVSWHSVLKVPHDTIFWMDELVGGVALGQFQYVTGQHSLLSFIPESSMNKLLQGHTLRNEDVQLFKSSTSAAVQDMAVKANGLCILRRQLNTSSDAFQLIAHRVETYTDENGKQSTRLGESIPVTTEIPLHDFHLTSSATSNGTRAEMLYFGVLRAVHVYSFDCSTNALVLARVVDHQGFDTEPYHESIETTLTPNGSSVSWTIAYRKDMAKKDGANPLIVLPDPTYRVNSPNRASQHLQGMVELMDKGFVFALARLDRGLASSYEWSTSRYLGAIKQTVVQLETVINRAIRLNLTRDGRVAVVAGGAVAMSVAHLVNEKPHLLQAAVLKGAPLRVSTFAFMKSLAVRSPKTWKLAKSLDPISNLPLNGTSTNILVLEARASDSIESAIEYVSSLHQNTNNTGLALLDVTLDGRPIQLINFHMRPFLLRTLCPSWLINQTCV